MQLEPSVQRRQWTERPQGEAASPEEHVDAGARHAACLHVGPLTHRGVPAADLAPDVRLVLYVGADAVLWGADEAPSSFPVSAVSHTTALRAPLVKAMTPTASSGATNSCELKRSMIPGCSALWPRRSAR